jgi:hypothetical protein
MMIYIIDLKWITVYKQLSRSHRHLKQQNLASVLEYLFSYGRHNNLCQNIDFLVMILMEQHALTNVKYCLHTNIYSYLEISGGQSSNPYLNVVHFLTK